MPAPDTSLGELKAGIAAGHESLLEALEAASAHWADPILTAEVPERTIPGVPTTWTPLDACWHVLGTQWSIVDRVLENVRADRGRVSLVHADTGARWWASHADQLGELRTALSDPVQAHSITAERCQAAIRSLDELTDADLEAPWLVGDFNAAYLRSLDVATPSPTVRGLLVLSGMHLDDHSMQLRRAAAEAQG
jgi:hypothetical protein